jgi:molybdopterin-guanine dinucleotide biosynthesis protein A
MRGPVDDCTGVILAGGENRRMPVPKGLIRVHGRPIVERNLILMKRLFPEHMIVTNQPGLYSFLDTKLVGDIYDIRGPATGILTAMLNSRTGWIFVSACDMPFLNAELISSLTGMRSGQDAVVPMHRGRPEPLLACYSTALAPDMEKAILAGRRGLRDFLSGKRVKYVQPGEMRHTGSPEESFINLNTPEDVDRFLGQNDILKFKESLRRHECSA